jgi:mono/diheme cytochrome c family protein
MVDALYALLTKLGFTDPLHPIMVHMPIGLVIGALIFALVAIIFRRERLEVTARHAAILAFIFVFPTILFGVLDWLHFYRGAMMNPIKAKIALASSVTVILAVGVVFGNRLKLRSVGMTVIYALAFLAVVGLGYFGGRLVYGNRGAGSGTVPQEAKAGEAIFANNCSSCHVGGANVVDSAYPLKTSKKLASVETFTAFIRRPTMKDGSQGQMPNFPPDVLSDAQAGDLYKYVSAMASGAWK